MGSFGEEVGHRDMQRGNIMGPGEFVTVTEATPTRLGCVQLAPVLWVTHLTRLLEDRKEREEKQRPGYLT